MRSFTIRSLLLAALALAAPALAADEAAPEASPVGRWQTIDDKDGKPASIVVIWEEDGKLLGKVEKLLDPSEPDPKCTKCEGDLKDQPIQGMRILWDLRKKGAEWGDGRILDPDNGKTYKCKMSLKDGGKKLDVRGFIGISLLGRTQTWIREE